MPFIKVERDYLLDKIYECRGQIDFSNADALKKLSEIVDMIVQAPLSESQANYPRIKISR